MQGFTQVSYPDSWVKGVQRIGVVTMRSDADPEMHVIQTYNQMGISHFARTFHTSDEAKAYKDGLSDALAIAKWRLA